MNKTDASITSLFSQIKKTDESKLRKRSIEDKESILDYIE